MWPFRDSDAAIVRRTLDGHPEAFEPLVFRYQMQARAIARSAGLRQAEVDDAVQEGFFEAFRDLPSLREPATFGAWFLKIVRHVSLKQLRRQAEQPGKPAETSGAHAGDALEKADFSEYLWSKVAELPEGVREAIFLYYYEGESVREVARVLGVSAPGVKKRLKTGREKLREKLWRELEESLRALPSARDRRKAARRMFLLVLGSIPASWRPGAGLAAALDGIESPIEFLSRSTRTLRAVKRGGLLAWNAKAAVFLALALVLMFVGPTAWLVVDRFHRRQPPAIAAVAARPSRPGPPPAAAAPAPVSRTAETSNAGATPEPEPAKPEEPTKESRCGRVLVRLIWADDRTPAAGVWGMVIPWGSPDLYVDERVFVSGPDGTVLVEHIFEGGTTVMLDRGPRVDISVEAGEETETVIEVPPGMNVEGEVVDRQGSPVADAGIWLSYGGHLNWGNEVARTAVDGSFSVRSITRDSYIGARAAGYAASKLRDLKAEIGSTARVKIVLGGRGGKVTGVVRDAEGNPVENAKVMIGTEYPGYALLEDGATGFVAPPYRWFTDEAGEFVADSLAPGKHRVAVRAGGFASLEAEVEVDADRPAALELTLERGAVLTGRVTGDDGRPVSGVSIVVGDWRDFLALKVYSRGDGSYRLPGLPPGEIDVGASRPNRGKAAARLTVNGRDPVRWDPVLSQSLEIHGQIVDELSAPRGGYQVFVEEKLGNGGRRATGQQLETDAAGRFKAEGLSDLDYRILVFEPGCNLPCGLLEARPHGDELVIEVPEAALASAFVNGQVLDAAGAPLGGAKVICFSELAGYRVVFTGKERGEFKVGPLPPATDYSIEVQAQEHAPARVAVKELSPREERDVGAVALQGPAR